MSAFAAITTYNWDGTISGATTAAVYTPTVIDPNGVAIWTLDGAVYDANKRLSLSVKRPTKGSQVIRATAKLTHPVMDAVDTTLKVGDILLTFEAVFPKRATETERRVAMGNLLNFLYQDSVTDDAFGMLNSVY